jgi:predicted nucleic acid-binding protein
LEGEPLIAPELLDAEVLSTLRRVVLRGELSERRALQALDVLPLWGVIRVSHHPFLRAAFELWANYSAYDALYVAVAQRFGATILTCDGRLSRAPAVPGVEIRNLG